MARTTPAITCKKCGDSAEYNSHRGIYECKTCLGRKNQQAMARVQTCLEPVESNQAEQELEAISPPRREVPLAELERRLNDSQTGPLTADDIALADCKGCGAQVEVPKELAIGECVFCGRKTIIGKPQPKIENSHQCMIPFRIGEEDALDAMQQHLKSLWFRPTGISRFLRSKSVKKVYVPFWAFDVQVTTNWSGTAEIWEEPGFWGKLFGREGRYKRTPITGHRSHLYDDWLVCASHGVPASVVRQLEPFHTEQAASQGKNAFGDVPLEVAPIGPRRAWDMADKQIRKREYQECLHDARRQGGVESEDRVTMSGKVGFGEPLGKSAVLPLYLFSTRTLWGRAQMVVNGETGKVGAKIPYSWFKVLPTAALLIAIVLGICVLSGGLTIPFLVAFGIYAWIQERRKRARDEATFLSG